MCGIRRETSSICSCDAYCSGQADLATVSAERCLESSVSIRALSTRMDIGTANRAETAAHPINLLILDPGKAYSRRLCADAQVYHNIHLG